MTRTRAVPNVATTYAPMPTTTPTAVAAHELAAVVSP
jgi:hypothetical protein